MLVCNSKNCIIVVSVYTLFQLWVGYIASLYIFFSNGIIAKLSLHTRSRCHYLVRYISRMYIIQCRRARIYPNKMNCLICIPMNVFFLLFEHSEISGKLSSRCRCLGLADGILMQVGLFVCMVFPVVCWNVG